MSFRGHGGRTWDGDHKQNSRVLACKDSLTTLLLAMAQVLSTQASATLTELCDRWEVVVVKGLHISCIGCDRDTSFARSRFKWRLHALTVNWATSREVRIRF